MNCKHENVVQQVAVLIQCPQGLTKLGKVNLRRADVQIVAQDFNNAKLMCVDCGMQVNLNSLWKQMQEIYDCSNGKKINRIKAVRALCNCGLREAKYFVDDVFHDFGSGDIKEEYEHIVVSDAIALITKEYIRE